MPRKDAINKLVQIERLKQDSVELIAKKQDVIDLTNINNSQLITIADFRTQVTTYDLKEQNYKGQIKVLESDVKKYKRKAKWNSIAGVVSTIGAVVATVFILK